MHLVSLPERCDFSVIKALVVGPPNAYALTDIVLALRLFLCLLSLLLWLWRPLGSGKRHLLNPLHFHLGQVETLHGPVLVDDVVSPSRCIVRVNHAIVVGLVVLPQHANAPTDGSLLLGRLLLGGSGRLLCLRLAWPLLPLQFLFLDGYHFLLPIVVQNFVLLLLLVIVLENAIVVGLVVLPPDANAPAHGVSPLRILACRHGLRLLLRGSIAHFRGDLVQAPLLQLRVTAVPAYATLHSWNRGPPLSFLVLLLLLWPRVNLCVFREGLLNPLNLHLREIKVLQGAIVIEHAVSSRVLVVTIHNAVVVGIVLLPEQTKTPTNGSLLRGRRLWWP
mmetsp:Transcript_14298/g.40607  ORF Transcript_14298/g.40607 Transcript_14298/m.40607 type:complete len:334 (-) Transcript_14298:3546-4547(-)